MNRTRQVAAIVLAWAAVVGVSFAVLQLIPGGSTPPAPTPTPVEATQLQADPIEPPEDCRPCDKDARLTCCYPLNTVELDDAAKRVLNFAFNLEGVVGEHDRLFQVTAERLRACDRRYVDADARIAKLEDELRDLGLKLREIERARKRRR